MPGDWKSFISPPTASGVVELWRFRLVKARMKHNQAVAHSRTVGRDFKARQPPSSDAGAKVIRALRAERAVRDEYMRVLRIFANLVATGKEPEE